MKLTIKRELLLKAVQMLQSVVTTHATLPILYNVLLEADENTVRLTATDLSVSICMTMDGKIDEKGRTTVQARRLGSIIRELPEKEVDIQVDEKDNISIVCGASSYRIYGMTAEDFPSLPEFDRERVYSVEKAILREMLRKVVYAASLDESRRILNGVLMSFKEQKLTLVATDGRRLALIEQEIDIPGDAEMDVVLPTKAVNELVRCMDDQGSAKIQLSENMAAFDMGNVLLVSKLIEGQYPNFRQVIPGECSERVTLERESILSAVRRVSLLTTESSNSIKLCFEKNQLEVSAVTPDLGEAHETIPIKYGGKKITLAFNPEYIIDPLRNLTNDEVYFEMSDNMSPGVVKCDMPFLYVIMPLRLD